MRKVFYLFLGVLIVFFIWACEDDTVMVKPSNPIDDYVGDFTTLELGAEAERFSGGENVVCYMTADTGSSIIKRNCSVSKVNDKTVVKFETGLANGNYRLLYFEYDFLHENNVDTIHLQYGLGCRIQIYNDYAKILDEFDKTMQMTGSGTEEDPYIVTCGPHLYNLTLGVKDFYEYDKYHGAYFKQVANISLHDASYYCKHESGWIPIGNHVYPFVGTYDGGGFKISNMYSCQDTVCGVGLFGHITNSCIKNLTIDKADISGVVGVGGIAGCMMSLSGEYCSSAIINCTVKNSTINGSKDGLSIGGLAGLVDVNTAAMITQCKSEGNTITAEYNAGGIVGGGSAYSLTEIDLCENSSAVTSNYAGAGGIIGVADTLAVSSCSNSGKITGALSYVEGSTTTMSRGVGGICGGSGISFLTGCNNTGEVGGYDGVGGIIGSTRLAYTEENGALYNSTYLRYCTNTGTVSGRSSHVGGLCGEAQFACAGSINKGAVSGADHVGGIAGHTSLSIIHNTVNNGQVKGNNYVAGISALSNTGVYAVCQNYGTITGSGSHVAGIVSLTGNNTAIHYCGNHNAISGTNSPVGGIVGEMGDPREWSVINICEVVFGSVEVICSFAGPVCASIEHFGNVTEQMEYLLKVLEVGLEVASKIPSTTLWSIGLYHLNNPHHIEEIELALEADLNNRVANVLSDINKTRLSSSLFVDNSFSNATLSNYSQYTVNLSNHLYGNDDTNNDNFNQKINDVMHARAEDIAYTNENRETLYTIVGAVSLVVTTACSIAALVGSGGTLTPVAVGFVAGVVGGVNSISKGVADYTDNVIIISQCVNTGTISCNNVSGNEVGGLAGRIYDRGWVYDCLNSGSGTTQGGHLVGHIGHDYIISDCLTLGANWGDYIENTEMGVRDEEGLYCYGANAPSLNNGLTIEAIGNPNSYLGWNLGGSNSKWVIPTFETGNSFPVPYISEMTRE